MSEDNARIINYIQGALQHSYERVDWFFAFGTALHFFRDFRLGKNLVGDYDVCIMNDMVNHSDLMLSFEECGFIPKGKIVNDVTGEPFQLVYEHKRLKCTVDLYFMVKSNGYYWHTYDYKMEFPKDGVPSSYVFKGVRQAAFSGPIRTYTWEEIAPKVNFPNQYGTLLDIWYPDWFIPDARFGQSRCDLQIEVDNCAKLKEKLNGR